MNTSKPKTRRMLHRSALLFAVLLLLCASLLLVACAKRNSGSSDDEENKLKNEDYLMVDGWQIEFKLNDDDKSYTLIGLYSAGTDQSTNLKIPSSHNGLPVTALADAVFSSKTIQSVVIPGSFTEISSQAFAGCATLTDVTIEEGVTKIGLSAFSGCINLVNLSLPESLVTIDDHAFSFCEKLTTVVLPDNLKAIGFNSFADCHFLSEITFGNGPLSIEDTAFINSSAVKKVHAPSLEAWLSISFESLTASPFGNSTPELYIDGALVTEVTIPESITAVGDYAFYRCKSLTSLTIPNHVTKIGSNAFFQTWITSLVIPDSVTEISNAAFLEAPELTEITLGKGLSSLPIDGFTFCTKLQKVTFGSNITSIETNTFGACPIAEVVFHGTKAQWNAISNIADFPVVPNNGTNSITFTEEPVPEEPIWGDWEVVEEPTCEEDGLRIRTNDKGETEEDIIPALNHDPVIDPAVAPKCGEPGLTAGSHCDRCEKPLTAQTPVAALEHSYVNGSCEHCDAPQPLDLWDGTTDTSWYNASQSTFTISSSKQLAGLAYLVNGGIYMEGKTIYLDADLNLNGKPWTPIGHTYPFKGVFDGQNHTISNLKITNSYDSTGLFGQSQGVLKNITLANVDIQSSSLLYVGALLGHNKSVDWQSVFGTVSNCHVNGTMTLATASTNSNVYIGGLIGYHNSDSILNSSSANVAITLTTDNSDSNQTIRIGGLIGEASAPISNCFATGNVSVTATFASLYAGGLVGSGGSETQTQNCYATGNVTAYTRSKIACAGGLFGQLSSSQRNAVTLEFCYATGNVSATSNDNKAYAGGLVAYGRSIAFVQCYATGNVSATVGSPSSVHAYVGTLLGGIMSGTDNTSYHSCYYAAEQTRTTIGGAIKNEKIDGMAQYLSTIQSQSFFTDMIQWSSSVWNFVNGQHPTLK